MTSKFSVLTFVVLCFLTPGIYGQECVPGQVMSLNITASSILQWEVDVNEPCLIDEYIVSIMGHIFDEYHFRVTDTWANVSFLRICDLWHFIVTPVSAGVLGYERRLVDHVPLPPDADLSLKSFEVTHLSPRELLVEWDLLNHTHGDCTLQYRLMIEDHETGDIRDIYVPGYSTILHLPPCASYELSIRAINRAHPTIEGVRWFQYLDMPAHAESPPTLNSVEMGATTADLIFNLETFDSNRCPLRTLFVDAGNSFNISIPLQNIEGERPPVEVNLKGLTPQSMYFLKVSVGNSGGISQAAQFGVQTLPLNPGRK